VMGCTGAHPPWFCRSFGKLPAKEREKLIVDNKLCPFCLLHDKDKQCGAKQKPASVACTASGCKGKHAQKLHDLLKDLFREEGLVHVLQEDDGWEESEEAWELGEAGSMIVGAVRQDEEHSWQEVCEAWGAPEEDMRASIHQVRASGVEGGGPGQAHEDEQHEAEPDGLLVEGDEREYILELLMREAPPNMEAGAHPARAELVTLMGKRKRNLGKKLRKKLKMARNTVVKEVRKEKIARGVRDEKGPAVTAKARELEAKGKNPAGGKQGDRGPSSDPTSTSGRECSGSQEPEYSRGRRC
jgi:hypothetical protein